MKTSTRIIIASTVIVLGGGVMALGLVEQGSDVRYVHDILDHPERHERGTYTLLGMPQPATLPGDVPNPDHRNTTERVIRWRSDGAEVFSTLRLTVDVHDGASRWTLHNESRAPERPDLSFASSVTHWVVERPHTVVLIQGFDQGGGTPFLFGVYEGVLTQPIQPKPSQFRGHVASELPGGVPIPGGVVVYAIQEYTAGCSSKFLPPDVQEEYAHDPDIA